MIKPTLKNLMKGEGIKMEKFQPLIPLVYLVVLAIITVGFHYAGVPETATALIIGAGLTRVKIGGNVKP